MRFNKIFLFIIIMIIFQTINTAISEVFDSPEETRAYGKEMAQRFMPYYKNLKTCTPYSNDNIAKVFGKNKNQCHFRINRYDCNTPSTISWQYGKTGYDLLNMMQDDKQKLDVIEKHRRYYKEMEKNIIRDYCSHIQHK